MLHKLKGLFRKPADTNNEATDFIPNKDSFESLLARLKVYFDKHPEEAKDYQGELVFLTGENHLFPASEKLLYAVMPYPFTLQYKPETVEVYRDEEAGMFYVYLDGKRLYYPSTYTREEIQRFFTYISAEQHRDSPHRYLDDFFNVSGNDTVADLGAAEGNFSLAVVDKVKALYILEADEKWAEALRKTFEPWKDKVHIFIKYAGNRSDARTMTLSQLIREKHVNVVKMDIEGAEISVLEEAIPAIRESDLQFAITTYHRASDAENIEQLFRESGYETRYSKGYMLFVYDKLQPPYFRKAVLKARC